MISCPPLSHISAAFNSRKSDTFPDDYGPKCAVKTLLQVLFYAAGHLCSVFAACSQLRTAPSDQAVRDALTALCPDPTPLEQRGSVENIMRPEGSSRYG
jgi:hypothetical protein